MVELNEKFVLSHLLVAPYRLGTRDEAEKPVRACSPHRWMHLLPGGWRQQRRSHDLEQLEAEAKDGRSSPLAAEEPPRRGAREHLPPWRRKRFLRVPERDSPSHSSPERGSDCSRNSSDHEDGSSAAPVPTCPPAESPAAPAEALLYRGKEGAVVGGATPQLAENSSLVGCKDFSQHRPTDDPGPRRWSGSALMETQHSLPLFLERGKHRFLSAKLG
nr:PREDICTED: uncharacterized protein LOC103555356 [Equus przewalskii]